MKFFVTVFLTLSIPVTANSQTPNEQIIPNFELTGAILDLRSNKSVALVRNSDCNCSMIIKYGDKLPKLDRYHVTQILKDRVLVSDGAETKMIVKNKLGTKAENSSQGNGSASSSESEHGSVYMPE